MIDALFSQTNYIAAKKMLDVTALRHEAIAGNIANVETPQYKRIDVSPSFVNELQRAIASRDPGQIQAMRARVEPDPTATSGGLDGNTVQLEDELLKLQQNSVAHTLETQLVTGTLLRLRLAITGKS